jgi:hypothetical protein
VALSELSGWQLEALFERAPAWTSLLLMIFIYCMGRGTTAESMINNKLMKNELAGKFSRRESEMFL